MRGGWVRGGEVKCVRVGYLGMGSVTKCSQLQCLTPVFGFFRRGSCHGTY